MLEETKSQDTQSSEDQAAISGAGQVQQGELTEIDRLKAEAKNHRLKARKYREEADEFKRQIEGIKESQNQQKIAALANQGNWKEIADQRSKELELMKQELNRRDYEMKTKSAKDSFFKIAETMGCIAPDLLYNELESQIQLDDNYEIDVDLAAHLLEKQKVKRPFVFKSSAPELHVGTTQRVARGPSSSKPIKEQTRGEKTKFLKDLGESLINELL